MSQEKEDPAREQQAYLKKWLENDDKQRALQPQVINALSTATWQVSAMDVLRTESPGMARELDAELAASLKALKTRLPLPVDYGDTEYSATSTAVASTTMVFDSLVSVRAPDPQPEVEKQLARYHELVGEQGRADEAGRRVGTLFPALVPRFHDAKDAVQIARGSQREEERAAFTMRTFLDKLKGELLSRAAKHVGENMKWDLMAERLGHDDIGRKILSEHGATHTALIATLSNIGKARTAGYDFRQAATRFFDHVFIVCGEVLAGPETR